jgi:VanZ family protein
LFPGSIFGYFLYNDLNIQPQITRDFIISSNHFYAFALLSIFGFFAYHKTKNINFLSLYLIFLSIILEFFHLIIPYRGFEFSDLFGNLAGVIFVVIIYKVISGYA